MRSLLAFLAAGVVGLSVTGTAQALTILAATINHHGTTTIRSDDTGYSPTQQAGKAAIFDSTQGTGNMGVLGGIGVLKAQGEVYRNMSGIGGASVSIGDVIFGYRSTAVCQPDCSAVQIPVAVAAQIDGEFSLLSGVERGRARATATLQVYQGTDLISSDRFHVDSDPSLDGLGPFIDTLALSFFALPDLPYRLQMSLGIEVHSGTTFHGAPSAIEADFGNTYELNPQEVFQVGSDIMVNALSAGIVDNRIVHLLVDDDRIAVPTPAALPLMASGLAVFGVFVRRRSGSAPVLESR